MVHYHNSNQPNDAMRILSKLMTVSIIFTFFISWGYRFYPHSTPAKQIQISRFKELPHWEQLNHAASLRTFQRSCAQMLKHPSTHQTYKNVELFDMDRMTEICQAATQLKTIDNMTAKHFFEHYFTPTQILQTKPGLLTGYYAPNIEGRLRADAIYNYPIYATPKDLIIINLRDFIKESPNKLLYGKVIHQHFVAYDDRAAIYHGSLKDRAQVIAWVKSPLDGLELEIQGSGIIRTPEKRIILNYAAQNGHHYYAIGRFLIQEGKLSQKEVTMSSIRHYLERHPQQIHRTLIQNPSFVFFKEVSEFAFYGYQNIPLSPGYSLAVDPNYIPMGAPVFISTHLPSGQGFQRLMIAQDVGGAIKGPQRGDIYWGSGPRAKQLASDMKQTGQMWYLSPKPVRN